MEQDLASRRVAVTAVATLYAEISENYISGKSATSSLEVTQKE